MERYENQRNASLHKFDGILGTGTASERQTIVTGTRSTSNYSQNKRQTHFGDLEFGTMRSHETAMRTNLQRNQSWVTLGISFLFTRFRRFRVSLAASCQHHASHTFDHEMAASVDDDPGFWTVLVFAVMVMVSLFDAFLTRVYLGSDDGVVAAILIESGGELCHPLFGDLYKALLRFLQPLPNVSECPTCRYTHGYGEHPI